MAFAASLILLAAAAPLCAQSGDASYPTPIFSNEVSGRIAPRDVGDPRRTRHFYAFRGTEGDVSVSIETSQLLGDVDVFTATTLRPVLKFTLFGDAARFSKSFYVRKDETFILRVQARAVGDLEGAYTVRFGGSFAPAPAEMANAPEPTAPTLSSDTSRGGNTRRVTSTGARIDEPRPEPTPAEEAREAPSEARPAATPERSAERRGAAASRRGRGTRNQPSRSRPNTAAAKPETTAPESTETKPADDSSAATGSTTEAAPAPTPAPRRRGTRTPRRAAAREGARAESAPPPPEAPPAPTQRLIIITKDGEMLERDMGSVRRVTVENNQVVIVGKDGKVTRRPLADILKMSIEP